MLLPSILMAQEGRREATLEEFKQLGGIEQAHKLREQVERRSVLIQAALEQGSLNPVQMKEHVQFLINQGQSQEQIKKSIDQLGEQYLTKRMMKKLHAPLPETRVKDFEKKVEELEQKDLDGKLSKAELTQARAELDREIAFSHLADSDIAARDNFKSSLQKAAGEMVSAKKTVQVKAPSKSAVKVFVAKDFSLSSACLPGQTPVDQLNTQVKAVTKSNKQKVWLVWIEDKLEIDASYDEKQGLDLN